MDSLFSAQNGVLAALASTLLLIAGTGYKAYRMVKEDLKNDKNVTNSDKWQEEKSKRIQDLEEIEKRYFERIEKVQTERNNAIEMQGSLKGENLALKYEVERLKEENLTLKEGSEKINKQLENVLELNGFKRKSVDAEKL